MLGRFWTWVGAGGGGKTVTGAGVGAGTVAVDGPGVTALGVALDSFRGLQPQRGQLASNALSMYRHCGHVISVTCYR